MVPRGSGFTPLSLGSAACTYGSYYPNTVTHVDKGAVTALAQVLCLTLTASDCLQHHFGATREERREG